MTFNVSDWQTNFGKGKNGGPDTLVGAKNINTNEQVSADDFNALLAASPSSSVSAVDNTAPSTSTLQKEVQSMVGDLSTTPSASGDATLESNPLNFGLLPAQSTTGLPSAGQLQDELSALQNAPRSAVRSGNSESTISMPALTTADFKMTLTSKQNPTDSIIVLTSPTIDEERSANYDSQQPVHHPGGIQVYRNTASRTFNVGFKLISRTAEEATTNLDYLNLIRSWVMPYYGQGTADSPLKEKLGAPPDTLIFDVYGDKNINSIPTVLTHYHWLYPDNVDYVPTNDGYPFPTIIDISLSLVESYSPEEFSGFDITKYKSGDMVGAYSFSTTPNTGV